MEKPTKIGSLKNLLHIKVIALTGQRFFQDGLSLSILIPTLILNSLTLILLVLKVHPTSFAIPVRYSSLIGFDKLGPWYEIYRIGIFGLIVTIINTILAYKSFRHSRITSLFLLSGAFIIAVFCLIISTAFIAII